MDKQSIFRRESLDRVESPEQLDAYIKVSHPKVWLIMAALLVAVISVIVWSVVGSLPQTMTVKGVTVGGNVINCYECVENANTNLIGCKANITLPDGRNISGKVEAVSQNPYSQEEIRAEISEDWLADNVLDGNYSYEVRVIAEGRHSLKYAGNSYYYNSRNETNSIYFELGECYEKEKKKNHSSGYYADGSPGMWCSKPCYDSCVSWQVVTA